MKRLLVVMIGMAGALFGVSSYAASLDFVLGGGSSATVDDSSINRGSVAVVVNPDLDGMAFSLAPGESKEVSFFDLVFNCEKVACGGKTTLSATLDFASPDASATGSGKRAGGSLLGVLTAGMTQWATQPSVISTALGDFSVVFEDLFGRRMGSALTVHATITALEGTGSGIASVSAVPLPPAVWLFLTALLTLAGFNSRKRRGRPPLPAH
jgi:hypothetical protein